MQSNTPPQVSVVISAYYSDACIGDCLDALRSQTFRDFEIVIVNSSPEDRTRRVVADRSPEAIFFQSPTRLLPHAAHNRGVELARGSLLAFTDPDCKALPDWLERLVAACAVSNGAVGGSIVSETRGWMAQGTHMCKFPYQLRGLPPSPTNILPTANACYTRELWEKIGPFDGDLFCGDSLLSQRAAAIGHTPLFDPSAAVLHKWKGTLSSFLKERFVRGREFARTRADFGDSSRKRAPSLAVLSILRLAPLLLRVGRSAAGGKELGLFFSTLPIQVFGQFIWLAGESYEYLSAGGHNAE